MAKVFFIDEDSDKIEGLKFVFELNGFECYYSRKPHEALFLLSKLKPDVIVMSLHYSDVDGREIAKKIREIEHLAKIPLIGTSAMAGTILQTHRDIKTILTDLLPEPFNPTELMKLIKKYIEEQAATEN